KCPENRLQADPRGETPCGQAMLSRIWNVRLYMQTTPFAYDYKNEKYGKKRNIYIINYDDRDFD
ncbi:hypothetical protein AVEN_189442-1, partial [Araneus ventricosus]